MNKFDNRESMLYKSYAEKHIGLRVIVASLFCLITFLLIYTYVDVFSDINPSLSFGFWFSIIFVLMGGVGYALCFIFSLAGLILTLVNSESRANSFQVVYFAVFTVLPVVFIVLGIILSPLPFK